MDADTPVTLGMHIYRAALLVGFSAFLPLTAISYWRYRRKLRDLEILNTTSRLRQTNSPSTQEKISLEKIRSDIHPVNYVLAVTFATVLCIIGLFTLLWGADLGLGRGHGTLLLSGLTFIEDTADPAGKEVDRAAYERGALLTMSMAFMGAYIWGVGSLMRRYTMKDLVPAAYLNLGVRMILSGFVALLGYHAAGLLVTGTPQLIPAFAFLVGMFPERGIVYLEEKVPILRKQRNPTVRPMPLEMLEGVTSFDKLRLQEIGIDNCYDLAVADFERVFLETPYQPREIIDWILQAKLCVSFGDNIGELRALGIRTALDLTEITEEQREILWRQTSLTEGHIDRFLEAANKDGGRNERLVMAREMLVKTGLPLGPGIADWVPPSDATSGPEPPDHSGRTH